MKNVALHNLGCKVNSYELDVVQQMLLEQELLCHLQLSLHYPVQSSDCR